MWEILIPAVVVVTAVAIYNSLVKLREQTDAAWADIDVHLKRRHDLIPNLVETVKGYASHERDTLDAVVQARNAAVAAQDSATGAEAESMLGGALRQLFALAEAYQSLKANSNFQQLQSDLTKIENRLAAARRSFNAMVQRYNSMIQQFPVVLFARALGFAPHEFFGLGDQRRAVDEAAQVKP